MLLAEVPETLQQLPVEGRQRGPALAALGAAVGEEALRHDCRQLVLGRVRDVEERAAAQERRGQVALGVARDDHDGPVRRMHLHGREAQLADAELEPLDAVQQVVRKVAARLVDLVDEDDARPRRRRSAFSPGPNTASNSTSYRAGSERTIASPSGPSLTNRSGASSFCSFRICVGQLAADGAPPEPRASWRLEHLDRGQVADEVEPVEEVGGLRQRLRLEPEHRAEVELPRDALGELALARAGIAGQQQRLRERQRRIDGVGQFRPRAIVGGWLGTRGCPLAGVRVVAAPGPDPAVPGVDLADARAERGEVSPADEGEAMGAMPSSSACPWSIADDRRHRLRDLVRALAGPAWLAPGEPFVAAGG